MTPNIDLHERLVLTSRRMNNVVNGLTQDTYAGRLDAWHRLGKVMGQFSTWSELMKVAAIAFFVFKAQLRDALGREIPAWGLFRQELTDREAWAAAKALGDTAEMDRLARETRFLAPCSETYGVIQHVTGGTVIDRLMASLNTDGNTAWYETAGQLDFGQTVWAQANPNYKLRVGEDESDVYLTFKTTHGGYETSGNWTVYLTAVRQVCRNTVRIGYSRRLASQIQVAHRANGAQRVSDFADAALEIGNTVKPFEEKLNFLATRRMTREGMQSIFDRLFPSETDAKTGTVKSSTRRDNILAGILERYEANDGDVFPRQRGTALNALNAITEYTDHFRSTKGGELGRAHAAVFGTGDTLKASALEMILAEAEGLPPMLTAGPSVPIDTDVAQLLKLPVSA